MQAVDELGHVLGLGLVVSEQRAVHVAGDESDGAQLGILGKVDKRGRHAVPFVCGVPAAGHGIRGKLAAPDSTMFRLRRFGQVGLKLSHCGGIEHAGPADDDRSGEFRSVSASLNQGLPQGETNEKHCDSRLPTRRFSVRYHPTRAGYRSRINDCVCIRRRVQTVHTETATYEGMAASAILLGQTAADAQNRRQRAISRRR